MKTLVFAFLSLLLFSCGSQQKSWTFTSPEKNSTIIVSASRAVALDPYEVNIQISGYEQKENYVTEVNNVDLEDQELSVRWSDEQHCTLAFEQSDESQIKYLITIAPSGILVNEE